MTHRRYRGVSERDTTAIGRPDRKCVRLAQRQSAGALGVESIADADVIPCARAQRRRVVHPATAQSFRRQLPYRPCRSRPGTIEPHESTKSKPSRRYTSKVLDQKTGPDFIDAAMSSYRRRLRLRQAPAVDRTAAPPAYAPVRARRSRRAFRTRSSAIAFLGSSHRRYVGTVAWLRPKMKWRPSGRNCGHRCAISPRPLSTLSTALVSLQMRARATAPRRQRRDDVLDAP
jgi:hypothetical protein